jgi:pimeloyl-ACP methyl ester carboxylesterase
MLFPTFELIRLYRFTTYRAGHTKHSLPVKNNGTAAFSYTEKGSRNREKPSIVFVHGLSSNKETWIPIIKVSQH